jgi:transposase
MPVVSPIAPDQRVHFVLALLRKEDSLEGIARKAGVSGSTLSRWREEFVEAGKAALGSGKVTQNALSRRVDELMNELADRDQVIGELTVANRVLKKTGVLS